MNILVIGDACKDVFKYGLSTRLAPEAPAPVFNTIRSVENFGMAGNVCKNVESIISKKKLKINVELLCNENWEDIKKTRYVDDNSNHMFLRVDENDTEFKRCDVRSIKLLKYDLIIISDYNKGFLHEDDIKFISENHPLTIIDTKKKMDDWIKGCTFIKVNTYEYEQNKKYIEKNLKKKTVITLGKKGCLFDGNTWEVPEVEVKDVSGAGDSFLAGFSVYYLMSNNVEFSISFANECSTSVVQKRGVCVV
jgi:D-beta-D-heptose 7-phosphate kinase/D-beta-D-heptose 1-phosphate adenosyltransferase